jgi:flagellar basal-body rod protein FlgC
MLSAMNISASGLSAERLRMEVVANNIANANTTRTPRGGAFRRQDVVFASIMDDRLQGRRGARPYGAEAFGGVRVEGIVDDTSDQPRVFLPGHPDADRSGYVTLPNVQLPIEMVNLITANRGYEANLRVLQAYRQQVEQALLLVRT